MNAGCAPVGKRKKNHRQQKTRTFFNRKHASHTVDGADGQNLEPNTPMTSEDILALQIHGLYNKNDSSSSDSGLSTFDEDYYKYKPQPMQIDKNQIIVIGKRKNRRKRLNKKLKANKDAACVKQKETTNEKLRSLAVKTSQGRNKLKLIPKSTKTRQPKNESQSKKSFANNCEQAYNHIEYSTEDSETAALKNSQIKSGQGQKILGATLKNPPGTQERNETVPSSRQNDPNVHQQLKPDLANPYYESPVQECCQLPPNEVIQLSQSKKEVQTDKSTGNIFEQTAQSENPYITSSQGQKIIDGTLNNSPETQKMSSVPECLRFSSNEDRRSLGSKNEPQTDKSIANIPEQTAQSENSGKKSSPINKISNYTPKKPPADEKGNKIESQRKNSTKIDRQFDDKVRVLKNDPWIEQDDEMIHVVTNNESIPLISPGSSHKYTEGDILRRSPLIPKVRQILRHFPDGTDVVIVGQPAAEQTTQWASNTRDENAEHDEDKHIVREISRGFFARLSRLFCCFSRT